MCNTDNNNQCCHEADILCCAPLMHCCGGYSEHNNCCPHDRCCNRPCGGCCDPCGNCDKPMCCCCYKLKKAFDKFKEEILEEVNNIRGRIKIIEQDIENKYNELSEYITYLNEHAVTEVTYNNTTKEITRTINNVTKKVVKILPYDEAVRDVNYNDSTKYITKTIGDNTTNVVKLDFVKIEDGVTDVSYDPSTKYLKKIINGQSSNIAKIIPYSEKGTANGVTPLNDSKKVPAEYLPSYVDDVIEGYYHTNGKFYYDQAHTSLITGETGKIYVNLVDNKVYRWAPVSNSYVEISTYPSTLPNPYALKVKKGSTTVTYDGSAAKEVTIPTASEIRNDAAFDWSVNAGSNKAVKSIAMTNGEISYTAISIPTSADIQNLQEQSDWSVADNTSKAFIKNKPTSLKNPKALTITKNSTTIATYDGSEAKSIDIPDATTIVNNAIDGLDSEKNAGANKAISGIKIVNGKLSSITEISVPDSSNTPTTSNAVGNITFDASTGKLSIYAVDGTLLKNISLLWKKDGSTLTPVTSSNSVTANKFYDSSVN